MTGFGSSCGACKFLRRKCSSECVFAPYFCYDEAASHFAAVHKVFGASNVSKLLLHLPVHNRSDAAITISYEALARMRDPIYGCVAHIFALQQQVAYLQEEIEILGNQIASSFNCNVASCGSSEATDNNNFNAGAQLLPEHEAINSQFYHISQEILLSVEAGNSNGNTFDSQVFDGHMGLSPLYGLEDENVLCQSFLDPLELEGLFEGTELDNFGNNSCLNDIPIMENCIGPIWD